MLRKVPEPFKRQALIRGSPRTQQQPRLQGRWHGMG